MPLVLASCFLFVPSSEGTRLGIWAVWKGPLGGRFELDHWELGSSGDSGKDWLGFRYQQVPSGSLIGDTPWN